MRHSVNIRVCLSIPLCLQAAQRAAVTDPISLKLLSYIPVANVGSNVYTTSINGPITIDQGTIDILNYLNSKDTIHGFYAYQLDVRTEPTVQGNTLPGFGDHRPGHRQILTVNETHVFSPRLVNEFRAGYNRVAVKCLNNFTTNPTTLGYNNYPSGVTLRRVAYLSHPSQRPALLSEARVAFRLADTTPLGVFSDAATYTFGKHSLKFGGEGRRYLNANFADDPGTATFGTSGTICAVALVAGACPAGSVTQVGQTGIPNFEQGPRHIVQHHARNRPPAASMRTLSAAFIMDDYKITPNVTLEYGFRFEWNGSPYFGNKQATIFNATNVTLDPYGSAGYKSPYTNNFNYMPRLGFIWDVFGKRQDAVPRWLRHSFRSAAFECCNRVKQQCSVYDEGQLYGLGEFVRQGCGRVPSSDFAGAALCCRCRRLRFR